MATLIPSFKKENPYSVIKDNDLVSLIFNDNDGPASNVLWSSHEISSKLENLKLEMQIKQPDAKGLASFDSSGQVIDSNIVVDDEGQPDNNVLWSSAKIASLPLPPFQLKQADAVYGNLSSFGADQNIGQVIDSGFKIDDSQNDSNILWSSNKVLDVIASSPKKVAKFYADDSQLIAGYKVSFNQKQFQTNNFQMSVNDGTINITQNGVFKISFVSMEGKRAIFTFFDEQELIPIGKNSPGCLCEFLKSEENFPLSFSVKVVSSDQGLVMENAYILIEEV
ncbi:hypothetical protein IIV31_191L [Armadillidium vulgare iridescent virus]|uniref:Uncharacterized protein n=1 Tax=Armadillidium vulgare iridescent virus TaxID=72201 RepID=A0A068QL27_9VIRU|nr:hypothetical protein IIV31_191L [Armadillidium vulgare iridescent virus]CCV02563.1 hypothetical protein IIV31_191L [Armadillidium vulgare iridescent virus]